MANIKGVSVEKISFKDNAQKVDVTCQQGCIRDADLLIL